MFKRNVGDLWAAFAYIGISEKKCIKRYILLTKLELHLLNLLTYNDKDLIIM